MKTIGVIGGMSWESSALYYQLVNRDVQKRLGGLHSAPLLMYSFDFDEVETLQSSGREAASTAMIADIGARLAKAGADFIVIACNTAHRAAAAVEKASGIPLLHIADPVGEAIRKDGLSRVALIGSMHTMRDPAILKARLAKRYDLDVIVPDGADAEEVDRVILEELVLGKFLDSSRARYRQIMARLVERGAEGIILGCTEIPLLVKPEDATVPLYDTARLHACAAVDMALA